MFWGVKYVITRRNALLGVGLAAAGCAGQQGQGEIRSPVRNIHMGNISANENLELGPDENILIGLAGISLRREGEVVGLERSSLDDFVGFGREPRFFVFEASGYRQFGVQYEPSRPESVRLQQDGATVDFTPFAIRVPAGPYRIIGRLRNSLSNQNNWSIEPPVEPAEFNVRPGTVSYIGRFGFIDQIVKYSPEAYRQQTRGYRVVPGLRQGTFSFPPRSSNSEIFFEYYHWTGDGRAALAKSQTVAGQPLYCVVSRKTLEPQCWFTNYFFQAAPESDLPMLRQRFPRLETARVEIVPMRPTGSKDWKSWPQVLRPLVV
jgi:hypothetical protein